MSVDGKAEEMFVKNGSSPRLPCESPVNLRIMDNQNNLPATSKYNQNHTQSQGFVLLRNITVSDAGLYKCEYNDKEDKYIQLNVVGEYSSIPLQHHDKTG